MHQVGLQWPRRRFRSFAPSSSAGHAAGPWLCRWRMIRAAQRKGRQDGPGESGQRILAKAFWVSFKVDVGRSGFPSFGGCILGTVRFPMNLISGALAAAACCKRDEARMVFC